VTLGFFSDRLRGFPFSFCPYRRLFVSRSVPCSPPYRSSFQWFQFSPGPTLIMMSSARTPSARNRDTRSFSSFWWSFRKCMKVPLLNGDSPLMNRSFPTTVDMSPQLFLTPFPELLLEVSLNRWRRFLFLRARIAIIGHIFVPHLMTGEFPPAKGSFAGINVFRPSP